MPLWVTAAASSSRWQRWYPYAELGELYQVLDQNEERDGGSIQCCRTGFFKPELRCCTAQNADQKLDHLLFSKQHHLTPKPLRFIVGYCTEKQDNTKQRRRCTSVFQEPNPDTRVASIRTRALLEARESPLEQMEPNSSRLLSTLSAPSETCDGQRQCTARQPRSRPSAFSPTEAMNASSERFSATKLEKVRTNTNYHWMGKEPTLLCSGML